MPIATTLWVPEQQDIPWWNPEITVTNLNNEKIKLTISYGKFCNQLKI